MAVGKREESTSMAVDFGVQIEVNASARLCPNGV